MKNENLKLIDFDSNIISLSLGKKNTFDLNELRTEIKELNKKLTDKMTERLDELKITKRLKLIEKELKQKEESLFFSQAEVDVDTEKKIEELTNSYNFDVLTSCRFKLRLYPNA